MKLDEVQADEWLFEYLNFKFTTNFIIIKMARTKQTAQKTQPQRRKPVANPSITSKDY